MADQKRRFHSTPRFRLPGYNWCGPGCSGPGKPVNRVDAACRAHDKCYDKYGPICKCDREFMERLRPLMDQRNREGRHARLVFHCMKLHTHFKCARERRW